MRSVGLVTGSVPLGALALVGCSTPSSDIADDEKGER